MPTAARTPSAGAAVIWAPCALPVVVVCAKDVASGGGLARVAPTVVSKVKEPLVSVETIGEVSMVSEATPLVPEMVVSPVRVVVTEPLVRTEVHMLVATGAGAAVPAPAAVAEAILAGTPAFAQRLLPQPMTMLACSVLPQACTEQSWMP